MTSNNYYFLNSKSIMYPAFVWFFFTTSKGSNVDVVCSLHYLPDHGLIEARVFGSGFLSCAYALFLLNSAYILLFEA